MTGQRFDSVWDAIEDDPAEAASLRLRARLLGALQDHLRGEGLTQAAAARRLGVTQPRISDLMRGKIDLFSLDMLIDLLTAAGLQVEMQVSKAA